MYRLGEREHHYRKLYISLALLAVIIVGGIFFAKNYLKADSQIVQESPAAISTVSYEQKKTQLIDVSNFTTILPATWKLSNIYAEVPKPTYIWQGTVGEDKNRYLSVWVDASLPTFAVNKALHIQANGQTITVINAVSDNCTSFTGAANTATGKTPAKWETIDFLCDSGNYQRNVVGTVSPDGLNNLNMTGTQKGAHKYFFTYTDNTNQPDYSIFTEALKSFKAK